MANYSCKRGHTLIGSIMHKSDQLESCRWATIFGILAMDMTKPYFAAMAIDFELDDSQVQELRSLIDRYRSDESLNDDRPFADVALEWFRSTFGDDTAQYLIRWGTDVFQYDNAPAHVRAFLWRNALVMDPKNANSATAVPPIVVRLRHELSKLESPQFSRVTPQTAWDRRTFERHGWDDQMNVMEFVQATCTYVQFISAWLLASEGMMDSLTELTNAQQWGLARAKEAGMPLDRMGNLGDWPQLPHL
jgi:hypothetical protein